MIATRRFSILAVLFLVLVPTVAHAATHEFQVLIDSDNNAATGCATGGMSGVDQILVTIVRTDATSGAVERSYRVECTGGSFGSQVDVDNSGWPVGFNAANGGMVVENRVPYSEMGGAPAKVRLGFSGSSSGFTHSAIALANGDAIIYPKHSKTRGVQTGGSTARALALDGDPRDWGTIDPVVDNISGRGSRAVRMHAAYAYANASDSFLYFRIDANVGSDAPYAENDEFLRTPGEGMDIPAPAVLANDGDPNGLPLTALPVAPAMHGDVTVNADGSFTYAPDDPTSNATDSFQYKASNGTLDSNVAKVTIKVGFASSGDPAVPIANDDFYSTPEDIPLSVAAPGLRANDFPPAASAKASKLTNPSNGTVVVNEDGSFTYTPNADFFGTDTFTYKLTMPAGSDTATVTITVGAGNDPPVAQDDTFSVDENSPAGTAVGTVSATDVDSPTLHFAITGGNTGGAFAIDEDSGAITVANQGPLDFEANPVFTLTVTVSDGQGSDTATITILLNDVNDAPFAANDAYSATEDTLLVVPVATGLRANDFDQDGDPLTVIKLTDPANGVANVAADGSFNYQPNPNFAGTDMFTYRVSDGSTNSNVATVTITVGGVNDAPVNSVPGAQATTEDTPLTFSAGNGNAISVADVDAGSANVQVTVSVTNGTLTITGTVPAGTTGNGTSSIVMTAPLSAINAALSGLRFDPTAEFNTVAVLTIQTNDQGNSGTGGALSDTDTVNINVTELNDAPTAGADSITTAEDTPKVFAASTLTTNDSAGPPNESGQTLTVTAVSATSAQGGTVVLSAGNITYTPAANYNGPDSFTYTVTDNGTTNGGADPQSGIGTVNVTVTEVNDAPVANADAKTAVEDTPLAFAASTLTTNDDKGAANESSQTLTVINVSAVSAQGGTVTLVLGTVTYTPPANYNGPDSFTYTVTDDGTTNGVAAPLTATGTVNVTVTEVNDSPAATNDAVTTAEDTPLGFAASTLTTNDSTGPANESGQTLTVTGVSATSAQGGTVVLNAGTITYTPPANYFGADSFTYTVSDDGTTNGAADPKTANATVNVTVTEVNDLPVANGDPQTTPEDTPLGFLAATLATNDTPGPVNENTQTLTVTAVSPTSAQGGTVTLVLGTITYTPAADFNGIDTFTYTVTDNGTTNGGADPKSAIGTVTVTVTEVNDTPVANTDAINAAEDTPTPFAASSLTTNDDKGAANETGQTLTVISVDAASAQGGTVVLNAGTITYTPPANYNGPDSFNYVVQDNGTTNGAGDAKQDSGLVNITVTEVNDTPTANADNKTAVEDTPLGFPATDLTGNDSTGPGNENTQTVTVISVDAASAQGGLVSLVAGTITYTPPANYNGPDSFNYTIQDDGTTNGSSDPKQATGVVNVTVTEVNDSPNATTDAKTAVEDTPLGFPATDLTTNDTAGPPNESGQSLTVTGVSAASAQGGTVTLVLGTVTYNPPANYFGPDSFTYTVADNGTTNGGADPLSSVGTVNVTVTEVNDAPTANDDPISTDEDTPSVFLASTLTTNDTAGPLEGSQTLTVTAVSPNSTQGGTVTLVSGNITYTPPANYTGADSFTYTVTDNGTTNGSNDFLSDTATVNVTVNALNDAPVLTVTASPTPSYAENGSAVDLTTGVNITDVDDTDIESATVEITLNFQAGDVLNFVNQNGITGNYNGAGLLTLTGPSSKANYVTALDSITFSHSTDAPSEAQRQITWTVNDGTADSNTQQTAVDVVASNDGPTITLPVAAQSTNEDTPLTLSAANAITIADLDSDPDDIQLILTIGNGTATLATTAGLSVSGDGTSSITATGTVAELNAALDGLVYTPATDFSGTGTIQVDVDDLGNNPSGNLTATATLNITVNNINDAPVLTVTASPTPTFAENGPAVDITSAVNITDVDDTNIESATVEITAGFGAGDVLNFVNQNGITGIYNGAGLLSLTGSATKAFYITALDSITFSNASDNPSITQRQITWTVHDGTVGSNAETTLLDVTATNDGPTNNTPVGLTTNEDTPLVINGATISDPDADPDDVQTTLNVTGGTVTVDATTASVTGDGSNLVVIVGTVAEVNDALTGMTFNPTADSNSNTVAAAIQMVTDDQGNNPSGSIVATNSFSITVNPVNDMPSYTPGTDITVPEDAGNVISPNWAMNRSKGPADESGQVLTFNVTVTNITGNLTFSAVPAISGTTGTLTFTANANTCGVATIDITLSDDAGTPGVPGDDLTTGIVTKTLTIQCVNDDPSFTKGPNQTVNEDAGAQTVNPWATGISAGPNESDALTFNVSNDNNPLFTAGGQPAVSAAGVLTYTPAPNANGVANVTITLTDDGSTPGNPGDDITTAPQFFTITVNALNDAPSFSIAGDPPFVVLGAGATTVNAFATSITDGDPELTQVLTFNLSQTASTGTLAFSSGPAIDPSTGNLTYTPSAGTYGTVTYSVTLSDDGATGGGNVNISGAQSFTIAVEKAPEVVPPTSPADNATGVSTSTNITVNFDEPVSVTLVPASFKINCNAGPDLGFAYVGGTTNVTTVTLDPTATLPAGNCVVTVVAAEVHDTDAYDPPDGLAVDYVFDFVTNTPPTAVDDSTTALGHVTLTVADAQGVLTNDTDPDAGAILTVQNPGTPITTAKNGTITFTAGGGYTYHSEAGDQNDTDTVNYTVTDQFGGTDVGQLSINLGPRFIYVQAGYAGTSTGRDFEPWKHLQEAQLNSANGDTILVRSGNYNDANGFIALKPSQKLIGQGIAANEVVTHNSVNFTVLTTGAAPVVSRLAGDTITLSTNNVVRGLAIGATAGRGIVGNAFTAVTVTESTIATTGGAALDLTTGAATITLGSTSSTNSTAFGVNLNAVNGNVALGTGAITNPTGVGFNVTGNGVAAITYAGNVSAGAAVAVSITNRPAASGNITLSGTITGSAAGGITLNANQSGIITFSGAQNLSTGVNTAVSITNTGAATSFTGGALAITTTTGSGLVASGTGTLTVSGANNTVTTGATLGAAVNIAVPIGGVTFKSVNTTGATTGVILNGTGASLFSITGTGAAGTGGTINANTGISLTTTGAVSLAGVNVTGCSVTCLFGSGFGTLTVNTVSIAGAGVPFVSLTNGTVTGAGGHFTSIGGTAGGAGDQVLLSNVGGTFTVAGGTLQHNGAAAGNCLNITSGPNTANITWNGNINYSAGGAAALTVSGGDLTTLAFGGNITGGGGTGLQFSTANGSYTFSGTNALNGGDAGVDITTTSTGSFTFGSGTAITSPNAGPAFRVNNSAPALISYAGPITHNSNRAVEIGHAAGGSPCVTGVAAANKITFSGNIVSNGASAQGIFINRCSSGLIEFTAGTKTLNTAANAAVTITNNGATVNFTGGGLDIDTTSGAGFTASGGGTVTVTGGTNSILTTTGTGLSVSTTQIGANGLNFVSINVDGNDSAPTNGIVLSNTGSAGGLTVAGTGSGFTGGTIQDTSGDAILLTNVAKISFSYMQITSNLGDGIGGSGINGLVVDNCTVSANGSDAATDESGINVTQLTGTARAGTNPTKITNSTFTNNYEFEIQIANSSGTLPDLFMSNLTVTASGTDVLGNLVNILASGTANMTIDHVGGSYTGGYPTIGGTALTGSALHFDASDGTMDANVAGGTFTGNNVAVNLSIANTGVMTFDVDSITVPRNRSSALNLFVNASSTGSLSGFLNNNTIGTNGTAGSGSYVGAGISLSQEANATANAAPLTVSITNNKLYEMQAFQHIRLDQGISAPGGTFASPTYLTITGNTLGRASGSRGIQIQQNNGTATTCVDLQGNQFNGTFAGQAGDGTIVRFRQNSTGVFNVRQTSLADIFAVNTWPAGYNAGNYSSVGGTLTFNGGACPQP